MLHLRHVAAVIEQGHFCIRELTRCTRCAARIDEDVVLPVDGEDRLLDAPRESPGPTRPRVREGREQAPQ
jgi:hypothetical protein